jgi:hypothetical protein
MILRRMTLVIWRCAASLRNWKASRTASGSLRDPLCLLCATKYAFNLAHDPLCPLNCSSYHRFRSGTGAIVEQIISGLEMSGDQNPAMMPSTRFCPSSTGRAWDGILLKEIIEPAWD